jgi:hypothetical protein
MKLPGRQICLTVSTCFLLANGMTAMGQGDASPQNFQQFCSGPLPPSRAAEFRDNLAKTEQALAARNLEQAQLTYNNAMSAAYRGGGESDISVKCLGKSTAQRWHNTKLELKRLQTGVRGSTDLYLIAADQGAPGLVETVTKGKRPRIRGSVTWLEDIARRLRAEQSYGAFLLPGEQDILGASEAAVKEIRVRAEKAIEAALEAEATAFTRPPTTQERQLVNSSNELAAAVLGAEVSITIEPEVLYMDDRIGESMEHLSEARAWDLETNKDVKEKSWAKRAGERGDTVLDKAGDSSLSYRGRDKLYALAVRYYEFGQWKKQSDRAQSMRDSIQSDLAAEEAENEAKMEQAEAEIRQKAEAASQAAAEMMKTEEEKQEFKKEADAMEAELGF